MPSPCWPIFQPGIDFPLARHAHLAARAAHRIWKHALQAGHHAVMHAATHPVRRAMTACSSLPPWLPQIAAVLPVALPLLTATPAPHMPQDLQVPASTAGSNIIPSTSVTPSHNTGSSIISFAPTTPLSPSDELPPDMPSPSNSVGGPHTTPGGGNRSDLPPVVIGIGQDLPPVVIGIGQDQPQPVPEPSTWLVLALSAATLVVVRQRRQVATCG
jgi:PEP-CTERM motif